MNHEILAIEYLLTGLKPCRCWNCNHDVFKIQSYEHEGGWDTPEGRRWFYIECERCGYQTSFEKLGIKRGMPKTTFLSILKRVHPDVCRSGIAHPLTQILISYRNRIQEFLRKYNWEVLEILSESKK